MLEMKLNPIGIVHSPYTPVTKHDYPNRKEIEASLEIYPEFEDGLFRITQFKELWVIFWFNQLEEEERKVLRVHPHRNPDNPERGVFSTRSPARPNPIGLTRVTLLNKENNILFVKGLDAYNKTLILDIKEA